MVRDIFNLCKPRVDYNDASYRELYADSALLIPCEVILIFGMAD